MTLGQAQALQALARKLREAESLAAEQAVCSRCKRADTLRVDQVEHEILVFIRSVTT